MYDKATTQRMIDAAVAQQHAEARAKNKPLWVPEYHGISQIDNAISHLNNLWDTDQKKLKRPLTQDEADFIQNERRLCALDFEYWSTHYAWIVNWRKQPVRFTPNVAQSIIFDLWAEDEAAGNAIWMQQLKARRLGVSTLSELNVCHRYQFQPFANCVVASADPQKTIEMAGMIKFCLDNQPWWLLPTVTKIKHGIPIEFGDQHSTLAIEAGNQFTGVARGSAPNIVHLSELCEWMDAEDLIDGALLPAILDDPNVFGIMESTAKGPGWWKRKWEQVKRDWERGTARIRPVFLPWYVGTDIYPTPADLRKRPIPENWVPEDRTVAHAERARQYVLTNPLLFKHLAKGNKEWRMPKAQMWWREMGYRTAKEEKTLNIFLAEFCLTGDSRVSTEHGIVRIDQVQDAKFSETGSIVKWFDNGERDTVALTTEFGRRLQLTPDHRVQLANGEWQEAGSLAKGVEIALSPPMFASYYYTAKWPWSPVCEMSTRIDEDWGRLLGFFVGDGCWAADALDFACFSEDEDTNSEIARIVTRIIGKPPFQRKLPKVRLINMRSSNVRWWEMMWNLGMLDRRFAKKQNRNSGYKKRLAVPECIWRSPRSVVRAFLQGLFEADGHANQTTPQITYFSKSQSLIREVQLLLLGFGVNAKFMSSPKKSGNGKVYEGYCLRLNALNAEMFYDQIGFIGRRKNGGKRRTGSGRGSAVHALTMTDFVRSVEPAGRARVYDLTIADAHKFGANGVMVHNCSDDMEAFQASNIPIIDTEILLSYQERTRNPLGAYTIIGPDIPPALITPQRFWDHSKPPITIATRDIVPRLDAKYQLIPLLFEGYSSFDWDLKLLIWEWPQPGDTYGLGVDTSEGIGQDRAVIEALREATPQRGPGQVAEWASAYVTAFQLWPFAMAIGCLYSTFKQSAGRVVQSRMAVECMANGAACQYELQKRGWHNFHPWKSYDNRKIRKDGEVNKLGVYTNHSFRTQMFDMLLTNLSEEAIDFPSPYLVNELTTLEAAGDRRKPQAAPDAYDDRIMGIGFPLFSLHMGKPPQRQFARKRVEYVPGGESEVRPNYAVWAPESQARDIPNPLLMRPQYRGGLRGQVELARITNGSMPKGYR